MLAATTEMPCWKKSPYRAATSALAVQSTKTALKMFMPMTSSRRREGVMSIPFSRSVRQESVERPSRSKTAFELRAMPTMLILRFRLRMSFSRCRAICPISWLPTVPMPQMNRFSSWYSDREKASWMTLRDFRS